MPNVPPLPGNILGDPNFWPKWRQTLFCDKDGSPDATLYPDRGQLIRTIYIAHSDVDAGVLDFAGTQVRSDPGPNGGRAILRTIPANYPKRPWMYVQGVNSITPLGSRAKNPEGNTLADFQGRDTDDTPLYQTAEVALMYTMPTFKVKSDEDIKNFDGSEDNSMYLMPDEGNALASGYANSRYVTRYIKPMAKMLTLPRGLLKDENSKIILESIAITEHTSEYHYVWHQVPEDCLPEAQWMLGANCVNDAVFDGRPAGTLLFSGEPELKLNTNTITGQILYDVTYRFLSLLIPDATVNPPEFKGWNYIRRPTTGNLKPLKVSVAGGGGQSQVVFRDFDFRKLFRPG